MREFEGREECVAVAERMVPLVRERKAKRKAISDGELEAVAREACGIPANIALPAAVLTGVRLGSPRAPAVLALLKVAGAGRIVEPVQGARAASAALFHSTHMKSGRRLGTFAPSPRWAIINGKPGETR
jgi:hypothetical protein